MQELRFIKRIFNVPNYKKRDSIFYELVETGSVKTAQVLALNDVNSGEVFILLSGGMTPNVYTSDILFEKKNALYYYDYGRLCPPNEVIAAYNKIAFCHLGNGYGLDWMDEIRSDVPCTHN
jgi:hypothetical protein